MGLFDLLKPKKEAVRTTRSALDAARDPGADQGAVNQLVLKLLSIGLDGRGPIDSAAQVAEKALASSGGDVEAAISRAVRRHVLTGGVGGFATGVGGFATMAFALPVNVLEFYVQATRMVGAVATLRGYDVTKPEIRTAVLLTLVGSHADEVLDRAGVSVGGGRVTSMALHKLPPAALLMVNKAIGFRIVRGVGERALAKLGRAVPVVGGFFGGGLDGLMMHRIGSQAREEFPVLDRG